MGIILCEKHGRSGIRLGCEHVKDKVYANDPIEYHTAKLGDEVLEFHFELCESCFKKYQKLSKEYDLNDLDNDISMDKFEEEINYRPICSKCFFENFNTK